jgi:hypothetical protein
MSPVRPAVASPQRAGTRGLLGAALVALVVAPVARGALPVRQTAPNTPAGKRVVDDYLQSLGQADSARVVFSAAARYGEYTIWEARGATVFSSPRLGISSVSGLFGDVRLPKGPFVRMWPAAIASRPFKIREVWGHASPGVARVQVALKDGSRQNAILRGRWFVFAQDIGHPKPVELLGYDRRGRLIAHSRRGMF